MKCVFSLIITAIVVLNIFNCSQQKEPEKTGKKAKGIHEKTVQSFHYVALHHTGPYEDHLKVINKFLSEISSQDITPTGPMMGLYYNSPGQVAPENLEWAIGIPVNDTVQVAEPLTMNRWDNANVIAYMYVGSPDETAHIYEKFNQYMRENHLAPTGPAVERFLNPDPAHVPQDSFQIEIWFPVEKRAS